MRVTAFSCGVANAVRSAMSCAVCGLRASARDAASALVDTPVMLLSGSPADAARSFAIAPLPGRATGVSVTPVNGSPRSDSAATYSTGSNEVTDAAVLATDVGAAVVLAVGTRFMGHASSVTEQSSVTSAACARVEISSIGTLVNPVVDAAP